LRDIDIYGCTCRVLVARAYEREGESFGMAVRGCLPPVGPWWWPWTYKWYVRWGCVRGFGDEDSAWNADRLFWYWPGVLARSSYTSICYGMIKRSSWPRAPIPPFLCLNCRPRSNFTPSACVYVQVVGTDLLWCHCLMKSLMRTF